jgi:AcrR family transcriptional regulator
VGTRRRIRRTPEQAREAILDAARRRLLADGVDGLRVADVAADAGMSHATLLHHFGTGEAMRAALAARMGAELLAELLSMLDGSPLQPERRNAWLRRAFATLAHPRHAQLFAWLALQPGSTASAAGTHAAPMAALFAELLSHMQRNMPLAQAQFHVTLIVTSAIGLGVSRHWLESVGLPADDTAMAHFVDRLSRLLPPPAGPGAAS